MEFKKILKVGALASVLSSPMLMAAGASSNNQNDFEKKVHDYLVNNPEVLVEASQALQQKQQRNLQEQAKAAIGENANAVFSGTLAVAGNPKGKVTLVEFFDNQCIHCKHMVPVINTLVEKNSDLRVIYKEFPIFGQDSEMASKVALAAAMQGKYTQMHDALLKLEGKLNEKVVMNAAKSLGLNMEKLKKDMDSKTVTDLLEDNRKLAEKLHLMGTPAFIVASTPNGVLDAKTQPTFIPGAASEQDLQALIKKAGG